MNFEQARFNMVEQQIRPGGVQDGAVLEALQQITREKFVTEEYALVAYTDAPLPLTNGSVMLSPLIVARMLQALALTPADRVLEVGTGSGYVTALLSVLSKEVVTVDMDAAQQTRAKAVLDELAFGNIVYKVADGLAGIAGEGDFSVIYIGGACRVLPEVLKDQLSACQNGRIVLIEGAAPAMQVNLYTVNAGQWHKQTIFETCAPYLSEHTPHAVFDF